MIFGRGSIAFSLYNSEYSFENREMIFYAKGVSNFNETSKVEFEREIKEIIEISKNYKKYKFIYFSSQSIYSKNKNDYINHKINVENLITKELFNNYLIIRLPNIIGFNKNTLFNNLIERINADETVIIDNTSEKEFISVLEIPKILTHLIKLNNEIYDIGFNKKIHISNLVDLLSKILKKNPKIEYYNFEFNYICDYKHFLKKIENIYNNNNILEEEILKVINTRSNYENYRFK